MQSSSKLRNPPFILSLLACACFSSVALAEMSLDEVVVVGARTPTQLSELPGTVWVIEEQQIQQQTRAGVPLKEALGQLIPGLDIGSQGRTNNGQNLRGRSVLVMIDGVSLNSARGISRQFDSIDPFNIARIEVLSGANALYGGGATGGIINIVTKKGQAGDAQYDSEVGLRSGLENSKDLDKRVAQAISGGSDTLYGRLSVAYAQNGAAYDGSGDRVLMDITQTDLQYNRATDIMGNVDMQLPNGHSLHFGAQIYDSGYNGDEGLSLGKNFSALRTGAGFGVENGWDSDVDPQTKRQQYNATYHMPDVFGQSAYIQAYYRQEEATFTPFPSVSFAGAAVNPYRSYYSASQQDTDAFGIKLALNKAWQRFDLTYGVDADKENFDSSQNLFNLNSAAQTGGLTADKFASVGRYPGIDIKSLSAFGQGNFKATDDLTFSAGVRQQKMQTSVGDFVGAQQQVAIASGSAMGTPLLGKSADTINGGDKDYDVTLYNAGAIYSLDSQQQTWLNYSEGFELPDPAKYYGLGSYQLNSSTGNWDLKKAVSVEDSPLDGIKTKQVEWGYRFGNGALDAQAALFYAWSDKSITFDPATLAVLQQDDKKRNYGLEGQLTYRLTDAWQIGANGLLMRSQQQVDDHWVKQDVTSASPSKLDAFVGWQGVSQSVRLQGIRTFNLSDENDSKIDGYALFDLMATQQLPVGDLTLGVQNLLDKDYTTVWGQRAQVYYGALAPAGLFDYHGRGRTYSVAYNVTF